MDEITTTAEAPDTSAPTNYLIPECNLEELKSKVAKLAKRAVKLGSAPINLIIGEPIERAIVRSIDAFGFFNSDREGEWRRPEPPDPLRYKIIKYRRYYPVTVEGAAPKYDGWTFVAILQRIELEGGVIEGMLRGVPGQTLPPREMTQRLGQCDHCKTIRQRNDTYIVRRDDGDWRLVGSNCIRDFLGHDSPQALASIAEYLAEIGGLCMGAEDEGYFGGGRGADRFDVDHALTIAACVIHRDGFLSRAKAREWDKTATADTVMARLTVRPSDKDFKELMRDYAPTEEDGKLAEAAREWARGFAHSENDYLYNLSLVARAAALEPGRHLGLATAMIASYQRETMQQEERRKTYGDSNWFGTESKRERFQLEFIGSTQIEGNYGLKTICRFRSPEGNVAVWFAAGEPGMELEPGQTYDVLASVKKHDEYRGVKQTMLTRVAPYVDKVKKSRKAKSANGEPSPLAA